MTAQLHPLAGLVEAEFLDRWESDPLFTLYLEATTDAGTVEGSRFTDDVLAAKMIQDQAPADSPLKDVKLAYIRALLLGAMCRYQIPRTTDLTYQPDRAEAIKDGAEALMEAFPGLLGDFTETWFRKVVEIVLEATE